jgi:hypothetical protein
MTTSFELPAKSDLSALQTVIAGSPIMVCESIRPAADWATIRHSAEVDEFVLDWIVSHVGALRRHYTA